MVQKLLSQEEKAEELGVTTQTLRRWREAGDGPPFIVYGSITRYFPEETPVRVSPIHLVMRGEAVRDPDLTAQATAIARAARKPKSEETAAE